MGNKGAVLWQGMQWGCRGRRSSLLSSDVGHTRVVLEVPSKCLCSRAQPQHSVFPSSSSHHVFPFLKDRRTALGLAEKLPWGSSICVGRCKRSHCEGRGLGPNGEGDPTATDPHADGWELRAVNLLAELSDAESQFTPLSKS